MVYKMPNPEGVRSPTKSSFYMPYSPSAHALTILKGST